jgi:hypothetical protein
MTRSRRWYAEGTWLLLALPPLTLLALPAWVGNVHSIGWRIANSLLAPAAAAAAVLIDRATLVRARAALAACAFALGAVLVWAEVEVDYGDPIHVWPLRSTVAFAVIAYWAGLSAFLLARHVALRCHARRSSASTSIVVIRLSTTMTQRRSCARSARWATVRRCCSTAGTRAPLPRRRRRRARSRARYDVAVRRIRSPTSSAAALTFAAVR